jgi:hypothetical protein
MIYAFTAQIVSSSNQIMESRTHCFCLTRASNWKFSKYLYLNDHELHVGTMSMRSWEQCLSECEVNEWMLTNLMHRKFLNKPLNLLVHGIGGLRDQDLGVNKADEY